MISMLDTLGPTIWRASWQAALLALVVLLFVRTCGDRLAPRWRFFLWGIVVLRLLCVATPVSPWSAFNLAQWLPHWQAAAEVAQTTSSAPAPHPGATDAPAISATEITVPAAVPGPSGIAESPTTSARVSVAALPPETTTPWSARFDAALMLRIVFTIWLVGVLWLGLQLIITALVLRRRLSACRPVNDAAIVGLLETICGRMGLKRTPRLLVTPETVSPCVVGLRRPAIVLSESLITGTSTSQLRHVLAHEIAHLLRGDLWTNWLLLTARVLHWFNPFAWWTVREMQAEREAACDELAFAHLGETDRTAYASTIVELAAQLIPSAVVPGFIGQSCSSARLRTRIERLLRNSPVATLRTPLVAGVALAMILLGLTDAMPRAQALQEEPTAKTQLVRVDKSYTFTGNCIDNIDRKPLPGITVRLYQIEGNNGSPVEIAKTVTDDNGRFEFPGLAEPRPEGYLDRMDYGVLGFADDRPVGLSYMYFNGREKVITLQMPREKSLIKGQVVDANGRPVAGAKILPHFAGFRPVDLNTTKTDADGKFTLENVGKFQWPGGKPVPANFHVQHPDFEETLGTAPTLPAYVTVKLPAGCPVTGTVVDKVTGQPAANAMITARRVDEWNESFTTTNAQGRFRIIVPEGRYDFLADAQDRVCVALTGQELLVGEPKELPPLTLISGGLISGQVLNAVTREPVTTGESGGPIALGLTGASQPPAPVISPKRLALVDENGRFTLRAVPGENFPYFVNIRGDRMAWDTQKQPPVIVKDGETTHYDMLITPEKTPVERMAQARQVVAKLSRKPAERTAQILAEFRKLNHTVDETELWCLLMQQLVAIGPAAVPQLCEELDRTTSNPMLRRLGFALRAIGDKRAVPALIRAIPKTLLPSSSDFGLITVDRQSMEFMQKHDLDPGERGQHFSLGRPVREIFGTLHALTMQDFDDIELFGISLSEDPRRQVLQRQLYQQQALRWRNWWDANAQTFTNDPEYQHVNLSQDDEELPPAPLGVGENAKLSGVWRQAVLSPAIQTGKYAWHFLDLDTSYSPKWPARIPQDESLLNPKQLADWAAENGVDLMCITHRAADGTESFVLRAVGMKVQELSERDRRNLEQLLAAGKLPQGREVGELLMHFDPESEQLVPSANGSFLFVTREGNMGVIDITDHITRTADVTGRPSGSTGGVGFHKGVQFDLKNIIP